MITTPLQPAPLQDTCQPAPPPAAPTTQAPLAANLAWIRFKYALLTRIGSWLSARTIFRLDALLNFLELGRWLRERGFSQGHSVPNRWALFDLLAAQIADRQVLYLEFGVFRGDATRYWSRLLTHPDAHLHGFDSFEGLPEDWVPTRPKSWFSTNGQMPVIDDPRVRFFKGWFEQTLPHYQLPTHKLLVVILDADLYSSTDFVLRQLSDAIVPGTFLYFDEFNHRRDELRAFDEFLQRTGMHFNLIASTYAKNCFLFQRIP